MPSISWLRIALARVRALFRHDAIVDEIREEMDFHLDMRAHDYARNGLEPRQARREARHRFGNVAVLRDKGYDIRGGGLMESIWQDIRYSARSLRQSRTFTAVALTVLALAIGASTAIFSVVDAVVLRGLPYDEHDRLVAVFNEDPTRAADGVSGEGLVTTHTYLDWRRLQDSFEGMALVAAARFPIRNERDEPTAATATRVTWEFFPILRVTPQLGRLFTKDDETSSARVVILSDSFWRRQFGGAVDVVERPLQLGTQTWLVVGVLPRGFSYPPGSDTPPDFYVPHAFRDQDIVRGASHAYNSAVVARLKPGQSVRVAGERMNRVGAQLDAQYPQWEPGWRVHVVALHEQLVGRTRNWMLLLLGSVGAVLLIACANVGNLMLARATVRAREIGVRAALGAGRTRIVRALLIESVMLSLAGGTIGIALAYGAVDVLRAWLPPDVPKVSAIAVDWRVLWTAIAASTATGIVFGLLPAVHTTRVDLSRALRSGGRAATPDDGSGRLRNALIISELALATVLLTAGGLFVGSFINLMRVDPGFDYSNILTLGVSAPPATGGQESFEQRTARTSAHVQRAVDAIRGVPGIVDAAASDNGLPLARGSSRQQVTLPGRGRLDGESIDIRHVTPAYFSVLRIPVVQGRPFSDADERRARPVVIVNQSAAARYWPNRNPIGERITIDVEREVVGVSRDIRQYGLEQPARHGAYVPFDQRATPGSATVLARTSGDPLASLAAVKAAIRTLNPGQVFYDETVTLESHLDRLIATRRFNMALLSTLGGLGLVIAAVGVFGVLAYSVAQRRTEIGIRLALGASPRTIMATILTQAATLVVTGLVIGAATAWQLSRFATAFLFQLQATDARVFTAAIAVLSIVALAAAAIPARRAATIDPLRTLRES